MASAKIRRGGPDDDKEDIDNHSAHYWTGTVVKEERYIRAHPSPYNKAPLPNYIQKMLS